MPADEDDVVAAPVAPKATQKAAPKGAGAGAVGVKRAPTPTKAESDEWYAAQADQAAQREEQADIDAKAKIAQQRIQDVARLRQQKQVGVVQSYPVTAAIGGGPRMEQRVDYPALKPIAVPRATHPTVGSRASAPSGASVVRPNIANVREPTKEELDNPLIGAPIAAKYARDYQKANEEYARGAEEIQRAVRPQTATERVDTSALPEKAKLQQERLRRVAELAATLRNYGWNEEDLAALGGIGVGTPGQ